jgi:uncharacterized protein YjbI with pentapeptide repeats
MLHKYESKTPTSLTSANHPIYRTTLKLSKLEIQDFALKCQNSLATHCSLNKYIKSNADLAEQDLSKLNLTKINLAHTDLYGSKLVKTILRDANLSCGFLSRANLNLADLTNAYLFGSELYKAKLNGANLFKADLYIANLSGADLTDANLTGANLKFTNFKGTILKGTILIGVKNVSGIFLANASSLGAICTIDKLIETCNNSLAKKPLSESFKIYNNTINFCLDDANEIILSDEQRIELINLKGRLENITTIKAPTHASESKGEMKSTNDNWVDRIKDSPQTSISSTKSNNKGFMQRIKESCCNISCCK